MQIDIKPQDIKFNGGVERLMPLIYEQVGYSSDTVPEQIHSKIADIIQKGLNAVDLDFLVRTTAIIGWENGKIYGKDLTIESKKWARLLSKMESPKILCCFMSTLGEKVDIISEELSKNNLFNQFVMDAFGSIMVEKAMDKLEAGIVTQFKKNNFEGCRRFSPGYCDWNLRSGQEALCRFLDAGRINVRCFATGTMVPVKSVSAVMVGARHASWKSPCRFCKEINCPYRRET